MKKELLGIGASDNWFVVLFHGNKEVARKPLVNVILKTFKTQDKIVVYADDICIRAGNWRADNAKIYLNSVDFYSFLAKWSLPRKCQQTYTIILNKGRDGAFTMT